MTTAQTRQPDDPAQPRGSWLILGGFWLLIGLYTLLFLGTNAKRFFALSLALLPDQVAISWVDGQSSRFGLLDRVPILLAAGMILLTAYTLGRLVIELLRADHKLTPLELFSFATGAGLNLISLYILAVGLFGGLRFRAAFAIPAVIVLGAGAMRCKSWFGNRPSASGKVGEASTLTRLALWLAAPFVLAIVAGSLLPPWHFDVREYHLQVPKEWYQSGRIGFMPHNVYGNMPLGAELHAVLGMNLFRGELDWWRGALVGKAIIGSYAILTAIALFAFGRRFASVTIGAIAAFLYISTPWVMHVSASGLIDAVSGFYLFTAFYAFLLWKQVFDAGGRSLPPVLLCGFMAGAAVACKYPAVAFVVLPLGVAIVAISRADWKPPLAFTLAVLLACGLWFGKNAVLSGNPTYPLLYEVFDGTTRTPEKDEQWTRAHRTPRDAAGLSFSLRQLRDSVDLLLWKSDYASPLLVPLAALGLFVQRRNKTLWFIAGFALINVVLWWLLTHRIDRFLVPILPLAALLAAYGANWAHDAAGRRSLIACLVIGCLFNLLFVASPIPGDNRFLTSLAILRADEEADYDLYPGQRIHVAHKEIAARVRPGYRVLLVGEAQAFTIEPEVLYNTCFDDCLFEQMMKGKSAAERLQTLREQRISHIFIYWYELDRYRSPGNYGYSPYVTHDLIRHDFINPGLLHGIPLRVSPENSQLFEVVGWEDWN